MKDKPENAPKDTASTDVAPKDSAKRTRKSSVARRKAEEAFSCYLPNYKDLVDNATQGILIHRNFKPLYVNEAFTNLFGFDSREDVLSLPLVRPLVPVDLWPQFEESYHTLVHGVRDPQTKWIRAIKIDGSEIWLSLTERVVTWDAKPAVQWNLIDITQRVAMEQSLVESEQRLRSMLQILPTPIYIERRVDGQLLFVNRKTCLLFQQSTSPLLKRKSVDFFVDPEEWVQLRVLLDATSELHEVEVGLRTAAGRQIVAELAAIPLEYDGGPAILMALNDISQRKKLEAELFHEASTDALTNISNRRYFLTQAEADFRRAKRYKRHLSLLMCDLDHFKSFNDTYGHAAGDTVLQEVVKVAQEVLRASDVMGRLGGEEFAILLPETDDVAALDVAERLREHVAEHKITIGEETVSCSFSIGIAHLSEKDENFDILLSRADNAMYWAKHEGRNRVKIAI